MKNLPEILFENEDLLVVNKPAGWLSIPDRYIAEKANLLHWLQTKYQQILPVHRLDKETSGVICFARHADAHRHLSMQFEQHKVRKLYWALLDGSLYQDEGSIEKRIAPNPNRPGRMMISNRGKEAITHFKLIDRFKNFTWVSAEIKTGRTHQIRVHFQAIGAPLAVDAFYGPRTSLFLSEIKGRGYRKGKDQEERPLLSRLSLHARSLTILPLQQKDFIQVEAPMPKDLMVTIKQLRKWG